MGFYNQSESGKALSIKDEGVTIDSNASELDFTGAGVSATQVSAGIVEVDISSGGGGGAPVDAEYYVATANGTLTNEIVVTGLGTVNGIMKGNGSGAISSATAGTDYVTPTGSETLSNKTLTSPVINVTSDAGGDIYYRNSGGAFTRLGIGTSGQVLSVSAGGIPEWTTASGGGGGISIFECTVGSSGADYTTLGAAISSGYKKILVITDITETGNIAFSSGDYYIESINNNLIDFSTYYITKTTEGKIHFNRIKTNSSCSSNFMSVTTNVDMLLLFTNSEITFTTANQGFFYTTQNLPGISLFNCRINHNASTKYLIYTTSGADLSTKNRKIDNCVFATTNSNTNGIIGLLRYYQVSNINLDSNYFNNYCLYIYYTMITNYNAPNGGIECNTYCYLNNITTASSINLVGNYNFLSNVKCSQINIASSYNKIVNSYSSLYSDSVSRVDNQVSNGEIVSMSTSYGFKFSNCKFPSLVLSTGLQDFSNCHFISHLTIHSGADFVSLSNCKIDGNLSITGNDCSISNCVVGGASGGPETITINSGANRTIVTGSRTDDTISDSGTGSVLTGNVVY